MKQRLNITVDEVLVNQAKRYAARHKTSLSQMVEQFFKTLTRPSEKKNILELLEELPKPKIKEIGQPRKDYYKERLKKYGF